MRLGRGFIRSISAELGTSVSSEGVNTAASMRGEDIPALGGPGCRYIK